MIIVARAVPILTYTFGITSWKLLEIQKIDRITRKIIKVYEMRHPKADPDRLYVRRRGGGRGLLQTEATYKVEIFDIPEYLSTNHKEDQFVKGIKSHEITRNCKQNKWE
jgi:hypothetical protein